jgi:hypothetical protein
MLTTAQRDIQSGTTRFDNVIDVSARRNSASSSDWDTGNEDVLLLGLDGVDSANDRKSGN